MIVGRRCHARAGIGTAYTPEIQIVFRHKEINQRIIFDFRRRKMI